MVTVTVYAVECFPTLGLSVPSSTPCRACRFYPPTPCIDSLYHSAKNFKDPIRCTRPTKWNNINHLSSCIGYCIIMMNYAKNLPW